MSVWVSGTCQCYMLCCICSSVYSEAHGPPSNHRFAVCVDTEKVEALFKILRATGCFLFMGSAINSIQWAMKETVMGLTAGVKLTCHKLCVISWTKNSYLHVMCGVSSFVTTACVINVYEYKIHCQTRENPEKVQTRLVWSVTETGCVTLRGDCELWRSPVRRWWVKTDSV